MPSLTHSLASLGLQVLGLLGAVWIVWRLVGSAGGRANVRTISAGVLGAIAFALAVATLDSGVTQFDTARRSAVHARNGLETCFDEVGAQALLPYVNWVKARLPKHAVYTLGPYSGQPDLWCMTLVLLPSLPAGPGGQPGWVIALGTIPPDLKARIARHDSTVQVFAPGFALARAS